MRLRIATLNVWALPWGLAPYAEQRILAILVIVGQAIRHDAFNLGWLLLLILPIMLLLYARDARTIAPILAEHAAYRRARERDTPREAGDDA